MKKLSFLLIVISISAFSQSEEEVVKGVITKAYVEGIHNGGAIEDIRSGFHPSFAMLRLVDNEVKPLPIEEWITAIEKNRASNQTVAVKTVPNFVKVTVAGNSANVVLELSRENKKVFTDHLLLYKFTEGWRIVTKTYFRHP
jgi:Putative lumazine-binding